MTDQEIQGAVSRILGMIAPEAGFVGAEVRSDIDFDGESIIRVTAKYERRPTARDALIDVVHALREDLIRRGENRFVFLTNEIASERQQVPDED